jgi:hypothetical protein
VCVVKGKVLLAAAMVFLVLVSYHSARADVVFASFNGVYGAAGAMDRRDDTRVTRGGSGDVLGSQAQGRAVRLL